MVSLSRRSLLSGLIAAPLVITTPGLLMRVRTIAKIVSVPLDEQVRHISLALVLSLMPKIIAHDIIHVQPIDVGKMANALFTGFDRETFDLLKMGTPALEIVNAFNEKFMLL